jgi:hypothetical protein
MDPHTRKRDDLPDGPHTVSHQFRCCSRAATATMKVVIVVTAYNETWEEVRSTLHGIMDNLATLFSYTHAPSKRMSLMGPIPTDIAPQRGSMTYMFDDGFLAAVPKLSKPATTRELAALAPCASLRAEDFLVLVVFDGREKMSHTLFGDAASGCPLRHSDQQRMLAGLATLPSNRPPESAVRDCHLFEGAKIRTPQ